MTARKSAKNELVRAARQVLETEKLLGGQFMPARAEEAPPQTAASAPASQPAPGEMTADEKQAALRQLEQDIRKCFQCQLGGGRTNVVPGEGNANARLVFVGEAPGEEEDRTGRPFVGRAGELLEKMITAMGLRRQDVYICNVLKCRPPNNRTPNPEEVTACWPFLMRQLEIIRPKVIVTLGNPATQKLLNTTVGITKLRGQWQKLPAVGRGLEGTDVMPTFHPAFVLRQYTPENRQKVWDDLQKVMQKLGMKPPKK